MEPIPDKAVGVIPVRVGKDSDWEFLLVEHADGHWGFPKGHQHIGEKDIETAQRELIEETGVYAVRMLEDKIFTDHYRMTLKGVLYNKTVFYFLGFVDRPESDTQKEFQNEIISIQWTHHHDARTKITYPETRKVFDAAVEYLRTVV